MMEAAQETSSRNLQSSIHDGPFFTPLIQLNKGHVECACNLERRLYKGLRRGLLRGVIKGDARSLDFGSYAGWDSKP